MYKNSTWSQTNLAVIVICVAVILGLHKLHELEVAAEQKRTAEIAEQHRADASPFGPPTDDVRVFADTWFSPLLDDLANNYPIEPVRLEINDFLNRAHRGEFILLYSDEDTSDIMAVTGWEGNKPGVKFFGKYIVDYAEGCLWQVPCVEDMLAHTIVHERYHLDHHLWHSSPGQAPDPMTARRDETEAYWYSTGHALALMVNAGRLQRIKRGDTIERALDAYQLSENKESPAWQSFMDLVMNP